MKTLVPAQAVVETRNGKLRGSLDDGVCAFKGIQFAAPPYGKNLFLPPQPVVAWQGEREALAFGPKSYQPEYPPDVRMMLPELVGSGEDCLTLNVWAPEVGSGYPVMVWIPGGVYEFHATGACPWYDGAAFARDGVVCVTIGYRPGPDGFLYFGEGTPNLALLDQISALEWVRDNIEAFGGDSANVTVFGESAGALSIGTLLAMPRAKGLFRRAILQSGGSHIAMTVDDAKRVGEDFAKRLGVPPTREAIAQVPIDRLLKSQVEMRTEMFMHPDPARWGAEAVLSMLPWQPVVDGEVLPKRPIDAIEEGASAEVDILVGTNTDENRLFMIGMFDKVSEEALQAAISGYGLPVEETLRIYRKARPDSSPGDLMAAIQSDWFWRIPAIRLAEGHSGSPGGTYMYEFAWKSPQFDGQVGACHALEMPFVFDNLGRDTEGLWGANPPQPLADEMHAAWIAFATNGDPGWPQYELERRSTMRFELQSKVVEDPHSTERNLWKGYR
jgi:para-nitrobenzyl esterase